MPDISNLPFQLCAIDLDDTLLNAHHALSPGSILAIARVRQMGVRVVLASGRMHAAMQRYVEELKLETPVISYNGALVKQSVPHNGDDPAKPDEIWLEDQIAADLAAEIRDYARENHLQLNYYLHDILYSAQQTQWLQLYSDRTGAPIQILLEFEAKLAGTAPTKLVIVDSPEKVAELLPAMQERFQSRLYVTRSNAEYLEFIPLNASKAKALALVADRYGIPSTKTVAFGDSWNDIPMLQWAGLGLAVANAKPEVIAAADRTIGNNDQDGVATALAEIFNF